MHYETKKSEEMKNLITTLLLFIGLSANAQLISVTEGWSTGQRLSVSNAANHGDIGSNAVDLSYSDSSSSTRGATGQNSLAMGVNTKASGSISTAEWLRFINSSSCTVWTGEMIYDIKV